MDKIQEFEQEVAQNIERLIEAEELQQRGINFIKETAPYKYSYNFSWMGRPIIQYPQDMIAMQELIFRLQPDLIIETGIGHGGSLIFYASLLKLIGRGRILGIDIDIRPHNRSAIESHPMAPLIDMIEGSSISSDIIEQVHQAAAGKECVLVVLDSNHAHDHVFRELQAYASLVTSGSYCVVFDTVVEDMPASSFPDRPWGPGDNPKTAVRAFLKDNQDFEIDRGIHSKLLITVAPDGYLRRRTQNS